MEQQRHLEPTSRLSAYRHDRSSQPRRGASSRFRSRIGLRIKQSAATWGESRRSALSGGLPPIACLAKELCARRGFDIQTHGSLPSGGTILSVEDLSFDRVLVLLSLFDDARVYTARDIDAPKAYLQALSLRSPSRIPNTPMLHSVVSDLAHERTIIMSAEHCEDIRKTRSLLAPMRETSVDFGDAGSVQVLVARPASMQVVV